MRLYAKKLLLIFVHYLTFALFAAGVSHAADKAAGGTIALIETNYGKITLELFDKKAPITVKNFVKYANDKFYDNTIFHRVIPNFMIQGGGFDEQLIRKNTRPPIINEAKPFVPNARGTVAMARTSDPNSATSQFFINVVNNQFLNKSSKNAGYAVFGKVIEGLAVADKIANVKTTMKNRMGDVPVQPVVVKSIRINPQQ